MARVEPATTDLTVSLVEHTNFAVSDRAGDMLPGTYHGFFAADTRFLSRLVLRIDGQRLEPLASGGNPHHGAGTFYLASPRLPQLPPATISVFRDRTLSTGLFERIRLISYAMEPIEVAVSLELDVDFADIFEVRGRRRLQRDIELHRRRRGREFRYSNRGHRRATRIRVDRDATEADGRMTFAARLRHGRPWELEVRIDPEFSHEPGSPPPPPQRRIDPELVSAWQEKTPRLVTSDQRLARAWERGVRDMASLLLTGPAGRFIPAAGLPWYLAIFGRDAAITAIQSLLLGPDIAHGTLRQLGLYQGEREDAWREEEPGKIPHEVRTGELATLGQIPFARYYGSVDSTPLYVMLFVAACRWSGVLDGGEGSAPGLPHPLDEMLAHAEAALGWIERRADSDGLVWYHPGPRGGIRNQVWKDSGDSMRYADGRTAEPPIAAVEVQGYVVSARRGMADVYDRLGRTDAAAAQRAAADRLMAALQDRFWMASEGTYALGLDGDGHQIDGVTSNPGHLLWTDCVPPGRVASVAERLMAADMFSGWGIRTLSSRNPGYNPIGYHIGSVWPHDSSLVANGLARAGQLSAAQQVIDGLLDAAAADPDQRLPELFAGFDRETTPDLVPYPTACAPQAWATGAIFLSARTLMAMSPEIRLHPWERVELDAARADGWSAADLRSTLDSDRSSSPGSGPQNRQP
jgi:glycogen debranching enzyme